MGRWYKEEYETPIVFIFTLVAVVTPWQLSTATTQYGPYNVLRWWFGEFRFTGIEGASGFVPTHLAILQQQTTGVFPGFVLWGLGSILTVLVVLLSVSFLIDEERVNETLPVGDIATVLFGGGGVAFLFATVWMWVNGIPSSPYPIGAILYLVFAIIIYKN